MRRRGPNSSLPGSDREWETPWFFRPEGTGSCSCRSGKGTGPKNSLQGVDGSTRCMLTDSRRFSGTPSRRLPKREGVGDYVRSPHVPGDTDSPQEIEVSTVRLFPHRPRLYLPRMGSRRRRRPGSSSGSGPVRLVSILAKTTRHVTSGPGHPCSSRGSREHTRDSFRFHFRFGPGPGIMVR